jgi:hypothetical protein
VSGIVKTLSSVATLTGAHHAQSETSRYLRFERMNFAPL